MLGSMWPVTRRPAGGQRPLGVPAPKASADTHSDIRAGVVEGGEAPEAVPGADGNAVTYDRASRGAFAARPARSLPYHP